MVFELAYAAVAVSLVGPLYGSRLSGSRKPGQSWEKRETPRVAWKRTGEEERLLLSSVSTSVLSLFSVQFRNGLHPLAAGPSESVDRGGLYPCSSRPGSRPSCFSNWVPVSLSLSRPSRGVRIGAGGLHRRGGKGRLPQFSQARLFVLCLCPVQAWGLQKFVSSGLSL